MDDAVSRSKIAATPCLPALVTTCLPLCLWRRKALSGSWLALLWYSVNLLFCELTRGHSEVVRSFHRKIFVFLSSQGNPRIGLLSSLAPSDCPQDIQACSLPRGLMMLPVPSCPTLNSLVADVRASGSLLCSRLWLGAYFLGLFFFSQLLVMLPFEIPKLPEDTPVRRFPTVEILLPDILPRTGLCP